MIESLQTIYHSLLFYGGAWMLPISPGTLAWKLFKSKKGKIKLFRRDLICDSQTLLALPKCDHSLDEFTTAFSPFIPLLILNGRSWKERRKVLVDGLTRIKVEKNLIFNLPFKKGDVYWDFYEIFFRKGFELIFGRNISVSEFEEMYPGIEDINKLIKRQRGFPDIKARWRLYHCVVTLMTENNKNFIFSNHHDFENMKEIDRVSMIVEDILASICIQCTDLLCHMLVLYPSYSDLFKNNLDNCINETLRLFPLTDIWTRKGKDGERGWIASLIQLNRSGWNDPDAFKPERWDDQDHPPLISWGFDKRGCPGSKIGYHLTSNVFKKIISTEDLWIQPASNYNHDRTFLMGCQLWIEKVQPLSSPQWKFKGKTKKQFQQWFYTRLRILDQKELW